MTAYIEKAEVPPGEDAETKTEHEKSIFGVEDTSDPNGKEHPTQHLPDGQQTNGQEPSSNNESTPQHTDAATSEQETNGLHLEVKAETTTADVTGSALHDVSLVTALPPRNTPSEQFPLLPYHRNASDLNKPIAANLELALSDPLGPPQEATMDRPFDQVWEQPTQSHIEPYSSETEQHSLPPSGFAKLEFPDGHFYMTTYAVILGRDMRAWKLAKRQAAIDAGATATSPKPLTPTRPHRSASLNDIPQTPAGKAVKVNGSASIARSFVSESGGIIGEEDGHMELQNGEKRKKKKSSKKSSDSAPSQIVRKHSIEFKSAMAIPDYVEALQSATVDPNATAKLNPAEHMGDPNYVPLVPIHPPADLENQGKGISRQHVKIFYSFDRGRFEMEVLGRNGAFLDEQHYSQGSIVQLRDRSDIQIGGVNVRFVLPNCPMDGEPTEMSESVSGRMSFTFEDSRGASIIASDVDDDYDLYDERQTPHYENGFPDDFEDEGDSLEQSVEQSEEEDDEEEEEEPEPAPAKPRRGRPRKHPVQEAPSSRRGPKNGASRYVKDSRGTKIKITMSKRQKAKFEEQLRAGKRAMLEKEVVKKKVTKGRRESMKDEVDGVRDSPKESSKEASKTPADGTQNEEKAKPVRMSRDEAMRNGVDFYDPKLPQGFVVPPRKKGPGRPPKDGVMSKREKALLIRQAKEEEKARKMGLDPSQLPPPEMKPPKVTMRRNSNGEVVQEAADDDQPKTVRTPKPPRSPSPEMRIEDYTDEQLQRPNANYVIMIYEAIKASKTGKMNLQQIYSAIERRYPFFKFKTTSAGWQSSVRHNLSQHDAFVQVEKDGKGWLWGIKEGVPIERERRKKTPPPQPPPSQQRYPQPPYPFNGYPIGVNRGPAPGYSYQPPRFFPPSNAQSTEAKSQSYSSPYAADKPPEGNHPSGANQPRPSYIPPSYSRPSSYAAIHGSSNTPPLSQNQTPQLTKLSGYRSYRPSSDVVDTFRKVFVDSYKHRSEEALAMVNRAIKRVLHPETMDGAQPGSDEMTVALAFENCIAKAVGPLRYAPSAGPPQNAQPAASVARQDSPSVAVSIASSAAITAAATAAPEAKSTTPTEPTPTATTAVSQSQQQPQLQRPAEANLLNLLTGTRHSPLASASPQPPPVSTSTATNTTQVDAAKIAKLLEQPNINGDGEEKSTASLAKPDVEPLTPPAPALTPQPGTKRAAPAEDDEDVEAKRAKVEE